MSFSIDLHMHSCFSDDGTFTPETLVKQCKEKGIQVMAISDHNCIKANWEAAELARKARITYIPGIEIDCVFHQIGFHVLGYAIDDRANDFITIENNIAQQDKQASYIRLQKTQELGFAITEQELNAVSGKGYWKNCWSGEAFAEVLLAKPEYWEDSRLVPYRPGGVRGDNPYVNFYWDYYAEAKPCYAAMQYPTIQEVVEVIHKNGGKAILAHPACNLKQEQYSLLKDMVQLGIDGIEAFSSYHTETQAQYFYRFCKENRILITCGSDYHGKTKPAISLGQSGCQMTKEEMGEMVQRILS